jgi:hypothetical protein
VANRWRVDGVDNDGKEENFWKNGNVLVTISKWERKSRTRIGLKLLFLISGPYRTRIPNHLRLKVLPSLKSSLESPKQAEKPQIMSIGLD